LFFFCHSEPISHSLCGSAFSPPSVDELRRWRHQWKARNEPKEPYRKANWPWYGIASILSFLEAKKNSFRFNFFFFSISLRYRKKGTMPINGCTDVVALLCHTLFDLLPPPIQCCCLCASSHAKNRKEREKKKKYKIKSTTTPFYRLSFSFVSLSFFPFKLLQHQTRRRLPGSHFSPSCFLFSYWSSPSRRSIFSCTIFPVQKSISDSIYPSENK
jgi:hypothetical protein